MKEDISFDLKKIKTGWLVEHSWNEPKEKDDYNYESDTYAFATAEEAIAKVKELMGL